MIVLEPAPYCPLKALKIHRLNFDAKNRWEIKLLIAVKRLKETAVLLLIIVDFSGINIVYHEQSFSAKSAIKKTSEKIDFWALRRASWSDVSASPEVHERGAFFFITLECLTHGALPWHIDVTPRAPRGALTSNVFLNQFFWTHAMDFAVKDPWLLVIHWYRAWLYNSTCSLIDWIFTAWHKFL